MSYKQNKNKQKNTIDEIEGKMEVPASWGGKFHCSVYELAPMLGVNFE